MLETVWKWCEYVFPERKAHRVVRNLTVDDLLRHFSVNEHWLFTSLLPFSEPTVRAVIHEAKFHGNEKAWRLLGSVLKEYLKEKSFEDLIIPIPLSSKRQRARGYNQVSMILKAVDPTLIREDILVRTKDTAPQTSLGRSERLLNMHSAFSIKGNVDLSGKDLLVVDDVTTTGATLEAARVALAGAFPRSITLLALAH